MPTPLAKANAEKTREAEYIECFDTIIPHCCRYDKTLLYKSPIPFYHRNIHTIQPIFNAYNSFANELIDKINNSVNTEVN